MTILCFADDYLLNPTDDMYSDPDHAGTQPDETQLWVANFPATGNFQRIMIRFDLSEFSGYDIESAILNLTRFYSCPSGGTTAATFYLISEDWDEESWNHQQHIQYHQDISMSYVFLAEGGNVINNFAVDITELVREWIENAVPNYGLVIIANNNQKFSKFYSKEHLNENYRPSLSLVASQTSTDENNLQPQISLAVFPNPVSFSNSRSNGVNIEFALNNSKLRSIEIYDVKGKLIKTINGKSFYGNSVVWNGYDNYGQKISSGVYFCRLNSDISSEAKKIVVVK